MIFELRGATWAPWKSLYWKMRFTKTYDTNQGACSPRPVICLRQMKDFIWFCGGICAGNVLFFLKNVTSRQNCTRHPTERGEIQQKPTIQPNRQSTAILDWWTVFSSSPTLAQQCVQNSTYTYLLFIWYNQSVEKLGKHKPNWWHMSVSFGKAWK